METRNRRELTRLEFRVLFIGHGEMVTVQCLEYDIAAQGRGLREARRRFERTVADQLFLDAEAGKKPFEGIPPAPEEFEEMWKMAIPLDFSGVEAKEPETETATLEQLIAAQQSRIADQPNA